MPAFRPTILLFFLAALVLCHVPAGAKLVKMNFREALKRGVISAEGQGAGGYTGPCLQLCVNNRTGDDLDIYIEPATAFRPKSDHFQPLWAVGDEHLIVSAGGDREVRLNAFCGNSGASCPQRGMRYDFWQGGNGSMVRLMREIRQRGLYDHLGQRAVWSLTNNHAVNTIFDVSRAAASRSLADFTATLKGCSAPQYFVASQLSDGNDSRPVFVADGSRAYVDLHWTKESNRNMHVRIYREDGQLFREVVHGLKSSRQGHTMTIRFDARKMPAGKYTICLKDDDNYLFASRTVRLGNPCPTSDCDPCSM